MKEQIYILVCYDCSQELADGTLLELKAWVKNHFMDWDQVEYNCDSIYETLCTDCARLIS